MTTDKELKTFAKTMAIAIPVFFGLLLPLVFGLGFSIWPWIVAAVFLLTSWLKVSLLHPVYLFWNAFSHKLGVFNSKLILCLFFYTFMLAIALLMRLFGYDPMHRKLDKKAGSYRVQSAEIDIRQMEHPY
jgi:hypothetical protein